MTIKCVLNAKTHFRSLKCFLQMYTCNIIYILPIYSVFYFNIVFIPGVVWKYTGISGVQIRGSGGIPPF